MDLFRELAAVHTSPYMHIGGDETYLLGHDKRCQEKVVREGEGKLYGDYIKKMCEMVGSLGKRPLW